MTSYHSLLTTLATTKARAMDPEILAVLIAVFPQAEARLPPARQTEEGRSALAARILVLAKAGVRDPDRLRIEALSWADHARDNDASDR
jgi:hypothetical protein